MTAEDLADWFPALPVEGYERTSEETSIYNCVAWAMGDNQAWWEPYDPEVIHPHDPPTFWPPGAPNEFTLEAYITAFGTRDYVVCDSGEWEPEFQKIALFRDRDGDPSHVSLQIAPGAWTSKIGEWEDITHYSLTALEGLKYGEVVTFMQRPRPTMHAQYQDDGLADTPSSGDGPPSSS